MAPAELSVVFAFASAIGIGLNTVGVGIALDRIERSRGVSTVMAAVYVSLLVGTVVFWPIAFARGLPFEGVSPGQLLPLAAAGLLYPALFRLFYYTGIERVGANVTGALVAGNPAVAALVAVPVLGEAFTLVTAVGIACIAGGGALLQLAGTDPDVAPDEQDVVVQELLASTPADLVFPLGALVTVGLAYVLIKVGLAQFPHPIAATAFTQTAALVAFSAYAVASAGVREQLRVTVTHRTGLLIFVAASTAAALGWLAQFFALNLGAVGLVVPLVNTYPLVIAALSYGIARQFPRSPRVLTGILAIVAGASVLQL